MERFGREHAARLGRLRQARISTTQAAVLRLIASDYRAAPRDIGRLNPAAAQERPAARLRTWLRRTARHYADLAAAAKGHWPKRYADASRKIADDEKDLNVLFRRIPA
jgi:hypothetical protein